MQEKMQLRGLHSLTGRGVCGLAWRVAAGATGLFIAVVAVCGPTLLSFHGVCCGGCMGNRAYLAIDHQGGLFGTCEEGGVHAVIGGW